MRKHFSSGFTLIELMVTLALIVALATVAIPSMREMLHNSRITSQVNMLTTTLNFARSEAIKRGRPVAVCTSNNQTSCTGSAWTNGFIAFTDTISYRTIDGQDAILRVQEGFSQGSTLSVVGTTDYLRFEPTGFATARCEDCADNTTTFALYDSSYPHHVNWLSRTLLTLLAINDAHASMGGGMGGMGGGGMGGMGGGGMGGMGGGGMGGMGGGGTGSIIVATFTFCDSSTSGWKGKVVNVLHTGRISTGTITCP